MRLPVMPPIGPMLAKSVKQLPIGDFTYEPKWDGFRCIAFRDGDEVELGSRNERPLTRYFPEVVEAIRANLPARCVVDGEIVVTNTVPVPEDKRIDKIVVLSIAKIVADAIRAVFEDASVSEIFNDQNQL